MAATGIPKIDQLLAGADNAPIGPNDPDGHAVGIVQDLLRGLSFSGIPGLLDTARGRYGPRTTDSVRTFQQTCGLPATGAVDRATLQQMIQKPAAKPAVSRGYLSLVLDLMFQGMTRVLSLTSQFEGAGLFGAINRNTDKAGLSYGLIQWAQKPGRLRELLAVFQQQQPQRFVQVLGGGDANLADALVRHTARAQGGVDAAGRTTDPRFDLVQDPWLTRFRQAALDKDLQKVQVSVALEAFGDSFQRFQAFAPQLRSERAVAFMLDLANQHGDGGARGIFTTVAQPGMSETQLLSALAAESIRRVQAQFGPGPFTESTRNRREAFRTSPLLSDQPFQAG
jgi:peptidoglycan hydrolase-like protein with peptidoglycan-binding domain